VQRDTSPVCSLTHFDFSYDDLDFQQFPAYPAAGPEVRKQNLYHPCFTNTVITSAQTDAVVPLSVPITGVDGREMHQVVVPKDTTIIISALNCNRDPALWGPDSYEWKPDRWMSPLPKTLSEAPIPGIYSNL
jgi:hypothetical protein